MNPDGYELASTRRNLSRVLGRKNSFGIDLNRNFPDQFFFGVSTPVQPETKAVAKWVHSIPFVLSANFHGGSLVANYPFDDSPSGQSSYSATPDDDVFRQISRAYSESHPTMHLANPPWKCKEPRERFIDGITNGAAWYSVSGGMQDYNYVHTNAFEITLELGCEKFPKASDLPEYWKENKKSLINYIEQAHKGIHGFVTDEDGKGIEKVRISIANRRHDIFSSKDGDYWRLLVPGAYDVTATAVGHEPQTKSIIVETGDGTTVDFKLKRLTVLKSIHHQESEEEAFNLYQMQRQANDQLAMSTGNEGPANAKGLDDFERPGMNFDQSLLLDAGRPKRSFLNPMFSQLQFRPPVMPNTLEHLQEQRSRTPDRPR